MVLRRFRKEVVLAGFAAEAQAPMVVADKTKLSTTVCTAIILQFSHDALLRFAGVSTATNVVASSNFNSIQLHQRCALAGNAALRWRSGKHAALPRDFRRIDVSQ